MLSQSNKDLILLKPDEYPIESLTDKELKLILELKEKLVEVHTESIKVYRDDGHMLWRFLKAASLNVEEGYVVDNDNNNRVLFTHRLSSLLSCFCLWSCNPSSGFLH
mmetsp:Transcript_33542/g.56879  ORF Transcript_33542/g.56879 Transcript_33542/m.56879 type:complete len:107 (+) Transcript_33542:110-430(+)